MALTDAQLLCAAQSCDDVSRDSQEQLPDRFGRLIRYFAGKACLRLGLDPSEVEEVVNITILRLLDPEMTRFAPGPDAGCATYIRLIVQNAARDHARSIRRGASIRHDWSDPANVTAVLPNSFGAIADTGRPQYADYDSRELAGLALAVAGPDERELVESIFFRHETQEEVAERLGVHPSTVSRRLDRFYTAVAGTRWALALAG